MYDLQRLRTNADITAAPLLAASIFLDIPEPVPVLPGDLLRPAGEVSAEGGACP
jgi:hypothetical protein